MIKKILDWLGISIISSECQNCIQLRDALDYERLKNTELLEFERSRNKEMLDSITELLKPQPIVIPNMDNLKPISPSRHVPFSQRRAQLERESAIRAEELKRNSPLAAKSNDVRELKQPITHMVTMPVQTIEQLEVELSIQEN